MASFKLCVSDPKTGRTYQKEVKDQQAQPFIGLNIGENIKGELIDITGYEFQLTGGSDYCGFPMRSGILGVRKKITSAGGIGFRGMGKGIKKRKTVCGHKITDDIVQINLKVVKEGSKQLSDALGVQEKTEGLETKEKPEAVNNEDKKETKKKPKEEKPAKEPEKK